MWVHPLMSSNETTPKVKCDCEHAGHWNQCVTPKWCSEHRDEPPKKAKWEVLRPLVTLGDEALEQLRLHALERMGERSEARASLLWDVEVEQRLREAAVLRGELAQLYLDDWSVA